MRSVPPSEQEVTSSSEAGFLSGFFLAPLMVLVVGCALAAFTLNSSFVPQGAVSPVTNAGLVQESSGTNLDGGGIAPLFSAEVQAWETSILRWAGEAGVDPNLAATVMQIESCGDPLATSRSGAMGLFQVMPFHFADGEDPYDPDTNAMRGLGYLARSFETAGGDAGLALAGYNGGISVIGKGQWSWAAETIRYLYWGSGIHADALAGSAESGRLQEWMEAGGASLCRQAQARLGLP